MPDPIPPPQIPNIAAAAKAVSAFGLSLIDFARSLDDFFQQFRSIVLESESYLRDALQSVIDYCNALDIINADPQTPPPPPQTPAFPPARCPAHPTPPKPQARGPPHPAHRGQGSPTG